MRRKSLPHEAFRLALSDELRQLADPVQILVVATRVLGEHLGVSRVIYGDVLADGDQFVAAPGYAVGVAQIPRVHRLKDFGPSLIAELSAGRTLVVPDVVADARLSEVERAAYAPSHCAAHVTVPLLKEGRLVALLAVHDSKPRAWVAADVRLIEETAERTWAAVEQARAEARLRQSEQRLEAALLAGQMAYWHWDPASERLEGSSTMAEVFGAGPADLQSCADIWRLVHPDDAEAHRSVVELAAREGRGWHREVRIVRPKDGRIAWIEERANATYDESTGKRAFAGIVWDITPRKNAEEALRQTEAALRESEHRQAFLVRLEDVLRPLRDAVRVQAATCRLLGQHLNADRTFYVEIEEDQGEAAVGPDYFREGMASIAMRYATTEYMESLAVLRSGRVMVVADTRASALLSQKDAYLMLDIVAFVGVPLVKEGRLVGTLSVTSTVPRDWSAAEVALIQDVAERTWAAVARARAEVELRESEERFRAMAKSAEAANRAKDEFLAILSHELRTPLAPILLWGHGLLSGAMSIKDLDRAMKAIVQSAESLSRLIEDLIDLARLNSGGLLLSPASSHVAQVARAAIEVIRPLAHAKGVQLDVAVSEVGMAVLDPGRFQQVLWNLLSNALKFTEAGGTVSLRLAQRDAQIEVEVSDTGRGIAPEFFPRLFERFGQPDTGHNREHKGLGIGLALSRHLVELHGGTLSAHSDGLGRGSTFRVRIPHVSGDELEEVDGGDRPVHDAARLRDLRVLLVEDDVSTREAMTWTLEGAGASVRAVGSGFEALRVFETGGSDAPEVMVCDIGLPAMDGYELIQRAIALQLAQGKTPIPACAVSAHARDVDRKRAIEVGFDLFVAKPVSPEGLLEAIDELAIVAART
jgi:PAS domain S-box-containing protein